ncbi:DUF7156 family protein [Mycobacterium marseillense]|uniref:DUF7156 family protein n=1 Tax=Mycobacterium marseillense TaxID=701042 RepID=UPI00119CF274|nr:hypothetical protein [Mycobacterium marseillense]
MATDRDYQNTSMKELPAEFFLPPQTNAALKREAVRLVAVSVAFIVVLGIIVALTQGIVVTV